MKYVLFNPHACSGTAKKCIEPYLESLADSYTLVDMTEISSYEEFFAPIFESDEVVICGGDGTINRFVNESSGVEIKCSVYYLPAGSGNDFARDVALTDASEPFLLDDYIKDLPSVTVNGKESFFINGVGYGIDGYCCEVGDKLRETGKNVNYTSIAIKGLLFHFKPANATVTVDGVEHKFKRVWIAPTMFGRFYGGGMMPTPNQKRGEGEKKLSLMILYNTSKLKTLMIFPKLFKGEHVGNKRVAIFTGDEITVSFDRPTALQIDGETILGVQEYTARATKHDTVSVG